MREYRHNTKEHGDKRMKLPVFRKNNKRKGNKGSFSLVKGLLIVVGALAMAVVSVSVYDDVKMNIQYDVTRVTYTEFKDELDNGEIDVVYIDSNTSTIYWVNKEDSLPVLEENRKNAEEPETGDFTVDERIKAANEATVMKSTTNPSYDEFNKDLLENGVIIQNGIRFNKTGSLVQGIGALLITIVPVTFLGILTVQLMSSFTGAKTSKATQDSDVTFDDIIGLDESIEEIKFMIDVLKDKELRDKYNLKQPKGLLLYGPPGSGKTMIAKAISNEMGVKMISVDSSSLIELYVGMGPKRIREVFKEARKNSPCIVFIDEIDAIGASRSNKNRSSEDDKTLNALLQEIDGFSSESGIFVIGATNVDDRLDAALVRAGRFDRKIVINPPRNWKVRKEMYEHYLKGVDTSNIDLDGISKQSSGFTGADIANIVNEAKMLAVASKSDKLDTKIMEEAIDNSMFKGSRTKHVEEKDIKLSAYHESGHALSSLLNNLPIARISIVPNTAGTGGMVITEDKNTFVITKSELRSRIKMAYAGRAAEEVMFGADECTTGASQDIKVATQYIRAYIENYGFDSKIGLVDVKSMMESGYLMETDVSKEIYSMAKELYKETYDEISNHKDILEDMAKIVAENETVSGQYITKWFNERVNKQ